jgi:hypothetical protein
LTLRLKKKKKKAFATAEKKGTKQTRVA